MEKDAVAGTTSLCTFCPKMCRVACPVAEATGREEVTPWGLMTALGQVRDGRLPLDEELGALFHACSGCGRCERFCAHENDVPEALRLARNLVAEAGVAPEAVQESIRRLRSTGNIKGEDLAEKQRTLLGARVGAEARTLFFPGCEALSSGGDAVVDAVRVLEHLGFGPITLLPDAPCSGSPYESAGAPDEFARHAQRLAERLSKYALIVSSCPSCVRTLTQRYTAVGAPVRARVVHLVELAAERMPRSATASFKAAYHDPCHLGRGMDQYEPPREALRRAGAEVVEWFDRRETSRCSGGGFGLPRVMPEAARAIAERRVSDVPESADIIATACPTCTAQLRPVSKKPVVDVATLLAKALGLRE